MGIEISAILRQRLCCGYSAGGKPSPVVAVYRRGKYRLGCREHCILHQWQWLFLLGWKCCCLLTRAVIDGAAALPLFYLRVTACDALSKAWLDISPGPAGRLLQVPSQIAELPRKREMFLRTQKGLNGVDRNQDITESCLDCVVGWYFLCNAQKTVFLFSYLQLFQGQWSC